MTGSSQQPGEDCWVRLRRLTAARIALGRAGVSLPTAHHLDFQLAHAQARDAVHARLDTVALEASLIGMGLDVLQVSSAAADRVTYLQRPDLGRSLSSESRAMLARRAKALPKASRSRAGPRLDVALAVVDGLSALAVERNAVPLLGAVVPMLAGAGLRLGPVTIVEQGRVAIGDEIGGTLSARLMVVLIGERPGLSSPDSLGVYLTYAPKVGRVDSERNCISNIRQGGLVPTAAAATLHYLVTQALARGLTGVELKDESAALAHSIGEQPSFRIAAPVGRQAG